MTKQTQKHVAIAALVMSMSAIASRVLGFLREVVLAAQLGASGETDAYFAAFSIPDLLKYLLEGGALTFAFVPIFSVLIAQKHDEKAWRLFSNIATIMTAILGTAIAVAYAFTPYGVRALFPGFDAQQVADTVRLTRIILPQPLLMTIGGLIVATEVANKRFLASAIQPVIYNAFIICGGLLLGPTMGAAGFSYGVLGGALVGSVLVPAYMARRHLRYRFRFDLRDPDLHRYVLLALPLMFGVSLAMVDEWVGRYFASSLEAGSITWLNNARRLMALPGGLIGQAIGYAALPYLAGLVAQGRHDEVSATFRSSLSATATLSAVAALALGVLAVPGVQIVFQHGAFTADDAARTAELLLIFSTGVASWSIYTVTTRAFYAHEDTWAPMLTSTGVALLSLPIYALLTRTFLIRGIAWGSVIGMSANVVAMLLVYRWRYQDNLIPAVASGLAKGLIAGAPAAGLAFLVLRVLGHVTATGFLGTLIVTTTAGLIFGATALLILFWQGGAAADAVKPKLARIAQRVRGR